MSNALCFHWPLGFWNSVLFNLRPLERISFSFLSALRDVGVCTSFPLLLFPPKTLWRKLMEVLISLVIKTVPSFYALWSKVDSYASHDPTDCKNFLHKRYVSKHDMSCSILQRGRCVNDNSKTCSLTETNTNPAKQVRKQFGNILIKFLYGF